jgi:hypothetical protein
MTEARTPLHSRSIQLDGYARADGLFDVEARLTDTKHYPLLDWPRGQLAAGEPMHDMIVTMTVDADGVVRAFHARAQASPHAACASGAANFERLVGLSVKRGFLRRAAERIGGIEGCTHIRELLQQMATVAFQSLREARRSGQAAQPDARPALIDSCIAWAASGDWVKVRFPAFHRGADRSRGDTPRGDA